MSGFIILHVHKDCTDLLNEIDVANEFVGDSEHRLRLFGKLIEALLFS